MASFVFTRKPSPDRTQRFGIDVSREGHGLGRKTQMSAAQMMTLTPGSDCDIPSGVDQRAPLLKHETK